MNKRIAFKTLGCRLNQFETDALATEFVDNNFQIVDFNEPADVYVVNTCTVTNQSDHKSRNIIRQASRKNKDAVVVVTGCMANSAKEKLENEENITYVVQNKQKSSIFPLLQSHFQGEIIHPTRFQDDVFNFKLADKGFHTRSSIKIQDGCDNFCSFCIIPFVRGRAISRPVNNILENIKQVLDAGGKELVLTGVNIGRYSHDGYNFERLLEKILEQPGDFRVRISSIEPDGFGESFAGLFQHPKLTPHLHLCLQSGSEKILLQMRRMYSAKKFREIVESIRAKYPLFNFTTDVIVGFPGETEDEFKETCSFIDEMQFSHIHTFKYSERKGTRAVRLADKVPDKTKTERSETIRLLAEKNKRLYREKLIGVPQKVLVEKVYAEDSYATGYNEYFVPVQVKAKEISKNEFLEVTPSQISDGEEPVLLG